MQYCPKCKMMIRGHKECCPLCQGQLNSVVDDEIKNSFMENGIDADDTDTAFPVLKRKKVSSLTFIKMCTFLVAVIEIIFITLSIYSRRQYSWMGIVCVGALVFWLDILVTMYIRNNVLKVVTLEALVLIVIDFVIDYKTGFYGWSVMWMIPISLLVLGLFTVLYSKMTRRRLEEYIIYLFFDAGMSLLQIIPMANNMNPYPIPALITIILFLIVVAAAIIFRFKDLKSASARLFNV